MSREGQVGVGFWGGWEGGGRFGGRWGLFVGGEGSGGGGSGELQAEVAHFQAGGEVFGSVLRLGGVGWVVWGGVQGGGPGVV